MAEASNRGYTALIYNKIRPASPLTSIDKPEMDDINAIPYLVVTDLRETLNSFNMFGVDFGNTEVQWTFNDDLAHL